MVGIHIEILNKPAIPGNITIWARSRAGCPVYAALVRIWAPVDVRDVISRYVEDL